MRILLTGAGGQLGHDLQARFSLPLVGRAGEGVALFPFRHTELDITDPKAVQAAVDQARPECIINAAAYNEVDRAEVEVEAAYAVNAQGPANLAAAAARVGARLVHISTDYVFDGRKGSPYTEDDQPNPLSVYAKSKYEGERQVLAVAGARPCVLRTAWLYGVAGKNFVKAILGAAKKTTPLRVVADQVGSPTATADLARAVDALIRLPVQGLFHVVNQGACSRFEFAQAIVEGRVEVIPITTAEAARPAARPSNSSLTTIRWEAAGLPPLRSWQAALREFLTSLREIESETIRT